MPPPEIKKIKQWVDAKAPCITLDEIKFTIPEHIVNKLASTSDATDEKARTNEARSRYVSWIDRRAMDYSNNDEDSKHIGSCAWIRAWIHRAVLETNGNCYYTGKPLDWTKLGTKKWDAPNAPSVDHSREPNQELDYKLTSIRFNRCKQDLCLQDLYTLINDSKKYLESKTISQA